MAFEHEQQQAARILAAIEDGLMSTAEAHNLIRDADPTLVYFIFSWLREHYHRGHPAADAVLGRLAKICTDYPDIPRMVETGGADSVVAWFEDAYSYRELDAGAFIELVVEKLEG